MTSCALDLPDVSGQEVEDAKDELRRFVRANRRSEHRHPDGDHSSQCEALTEHALEAVGSMSCVAAYVSVGHEPCTRLLLERLHERGVRVLLPVLGPHLARSWAYYGGGSDLAERAPGRPPEPSGEVFGADEVSKVDALIIPALAIDRRGQRLGQGGGWYDRVLPLRGAGVPVFACVYPDELVCQDLPVEEHDAPVDAVITAESWFLIEGSAFQNSGV